MRAGGSPHHHHPWASRRLPVNVHLLSHLRYSKVRNKRTFAAGAWRRGTRRCHRSTRVREAGGAESSLSLAASAAAVNGVKARWFTETQRAHSGRTQVPHTRIVPPTPEEGLFLPQLVLISVTRSLACGAAGSPSDALSCRSSRGHAGRPALRASKPPTGEQCRVYPPTR